MRNERYKLRSFADISSEWRGDRPPPLLVRKVRLEIVSWMDGGKSHDCVTHDVNITWREITYQTPTKYFYSCAMPRISQRASSVQIHPICHLAGLPYCRSPQQLLLEIKREAMVIKYLLDLLHSAPVGPPLPLYPQTQTHPQTPTRRVAACWGRAQELEFQNIGIEFSQGKDGFGWRMKKDLQPKLWIGKATLGQQFNQDMECAIFLFSLICVMCGRCKAGGRAAASKWNQEPPTPTPFHYLD